MNEERAKILEMLAKGKITVSEAEELISALGARNQGSENATSASVSTRKKVKFLRVQVEGEWHAGHPETVNVRIPIQLLRSGIRLASLLPVGVHDQVNQALRENGLNIDISKLKREDLEQLVDDLADFTVDVNNGRDQVRVFCEYEES